MPDAQLFTWTVMLLITAIAAFTDLRDGIIPNRLTLPVVFAAPPVHWLLQGPGALGDSLIGLSVGTAVPLALFSLRAIGGGDVKLFAALGALAGPALGLEIQLLSFVLGALYGLGMLAWQGRLLRTLASSLRLLINPLLPGRLRRSPQPELMASIRLGGAIFAACALAAADSAPMP